MRRSVGLPGLLETIALGKSEKDYKRRVLVFVNFASNKQFHPALIAGRYDHAARVDLRNNSKCENQVLLLFLFYQIT